MTIRPYRKDDLAACLAIWRRASEVAHSFLGEDALSEDEALVRDHYIPAAEILVATDDRHVVGFIALLDGFIGGLFVDPEHHGAGVGRALVAAAQPHEGALEVEVYEANVKARAFYDRLGFVEIGRRPRDDRDRPFALVRLRLAA
jgi:ribosomal protein S18 acetylase RimI-like enzyme